MDRSQRVAELWNWLPAFRVVAEYRSIHKASAVLHVSASTLSRTIGLLEGAIGVPLFHRTRSGMTVTTFGATLLEGTRDALRRVDDALASGTVPRHPRPAVALGASTPVLAELLARAVGEALGDAQYRLREVDEGQVVPDLLRGDLDGALVASDLRLDGDQITRERLGDLVLALHARDGARLGEAVVPQGVHSLAGARVVATAPSVGAVVRIAETAGVAAILPVGMAPAGFRRIQDTGEVIAVFAVRRRALAQAASDAERVVDAARAVLAAPRS